jgi:predicted lipoprotein with Yx(FWY)xxD motif
VRSVEEVGDTLRVLAIPVVGVALLTGCTPAQNTADSPSATSESAAAGSDAATSRPAPTPLPADTSVVPAGDTWLTTNDLPGVGTVVTSDSGRTLYIFDRDTPQTSACYDACADTWMPKLTFGGPTGGIGLDAGEVGSIDRRGGRKQVTYYGHPLYYYDGDSGSGQAKGQGLAVFGGRWSVIRPDGTGVG